MASLEETPSLAAKQKTIALYCAVDIKLPA